MKYKILTPKGFITFDADDDACAKVIGRILARSSSDLRNEKGQVIVAANKWPAKDDSNVCIVNNYDSLLRSVDSLSTTHNPECLNAMKRYVRCILKKRIDRITSDLINIVFEKDTDNKEKNDRFFIFTPVGRITFTAKNDTYARVAGGLVLPKFSTIQNMEKRTILNMNETPTHKEIDECFNKDFQSIIDSLRSLKCIKDEPVLKSICAAAKDTTDRIIELINEQAAKQSVYKCCGEKIDANDLRFDIKGNPIDVLCYLLANNKDSIYCSNCVAVVDDCVDVFFAKNDETGGKSMVNNTSYVVIDNHLFRLPNDDDDDDEED